MEQTTKKALYFVNYYYYYYTNINVYFCAISQFAYYVFNYIYIFVFNSYLSVLYNQNIRTLFLHIGCDGSNTERIYHNNGKYIA